MAVKGTLCLLKDTYQGIARLLVETVALGASTKVLVEFQRLVPYAHINAHAPENGAEELCNCHRPMLTMSANQGQLWLCTSAAFEVLSHMFAHLLEQLAMM